MYRYQIQPRGGPLKTATTFRRDGKRPPAHLLLSLILMTTCPNSLPTASAHVNTPMLLLRKTAQIVELHVRPVAGPGLRLQVPLV